MPLRRSGPRAELGLAEGSGLLRVGAVGSLGAGLQLSPREEQQGLGPMALGAGIRVARAGRGAVGSPHGRAGPGLTVPAREWQSMVTVTRVRHSPVITWQVHGDEAGPRSS